MARLICDDGFSPSGPVIRMCVSSGNWSGQSQSCTACNNTVTDSPPWWMITLLVIGGGVVTVAIIVVLVRCVHRKIKREIFMLRNRDINESETEWFTAKSHISSTSGDEQVTVFTGINTNSCQAKSSSHYGACNCNTRVCSHVKPVSD